MGGRLQVARCRPALDSFFESIFFEERRQWTVDGDSFLVFIFFEERMGGRLQVARCRVQAGVGFVLRINFFRGTKDWSLEEWKVEGGRARMFWEPRLRLGVDRCDAVTMDSVRNCERL